MKTIIFDTNFLIYAVKFRIDIFSEIDRICNFPYKLTILDSTIKELEKLKLKELALIKKYLTKIEIIKSENNYVDKELIELSKKGNIIATQDKELKSRLKGQIIIIRQEKYLELKGI